MKNSNRIYILSLFIIPLFITVLSAYVGAKRVNKPEFVSNLHIHYPPNFRYLHTHDTIFVLSDRYIEIDLARQFSFIHYNDGRVDSFAVSTGTDKISKGILTREGIFTVQTKLRKGISRQFNNAELINWIGYDGNIGFHGLKGNSYYGYLGKKPSSHGCVRISREDGAIMYDSISLGTPVIVHSSRPARILAFYQNDAKTETFQFIYEDIKLSKEFRKRMELVYNGKINYILHSKFALDGSQILRRTRIEVGNSDLVPTEHENNFNFTFFERLQSDKSSKASLYYYRQDSTINEVSLALPE